MNATTISTRTEDEGRVLRVDWAGESSRFHAAWLRDNGQDPDTRDPGNGQKLTTVLDIPEDTRISAAGIDASGTLELTFHPDHWHTRIDLGWLHDHRYDTAVPGTGLVGPAIETWDSALGSRLPRADFNEARQQPGVLLDWLEGIARYGVALMDGLPDKADPENHPAVLDVIELFGVVRETNYGRFFEIRAEDQPINMAYTARGLQSHTDNPYRDPVPGLQLFGCIRNSAEGGESVVVDGFRAAEILQQDDPDSFALLSRHAASFRYAGERHTDLRAAKPMIELDSDGRLSTVRFNNRSSDALTAVPFDAMEAYYAAWRRFARLVEDPALEVIFKLGPGQLFVTDNTRVLHGRTAFTAGGARWMQGAYADKDGLHSTIRVLRQNQSPATP